MRGFGPARRGTFVSAKVPKTIFARARSLRDASASAPNQDGSGTRSAQTALAKEVDSGWRLRRAQGGQKNNGKIRMIVRKALI